MKCVVSVLVILVGMTNAIGVFAEAYHKTSQTVGYKCIFNHELLIVCNKKNNNSNYIASFIEKLKDTDVDAVMCCPTAWRTNLFPSKIDPQWNKYTPDQTSSKFRPFDYIMKYIHSGGDPVKDTLDACRRCKKDFFISYRMNDQHYVTDLTWPTHNFIWRDHPEYWLGDSATSPYARANDNVRLLNYMLPQVRDYYFSIIQELCINYDVDGVELDFQRFPRFFRNDKIEEGTQVMTAFVKRIKDMLNKIGKERGKSLKLCVRIPETIAKCEKAGLDVIGWDALGLIDMINVSSFYIQTMELQIEEIKAKTTKAKIYGEMNFVTCQREKNIRRYTTLEIYRAAALNLLHRGADGLSIFNYDYVPAKQRVAMAEGLMRITDVEYLKTMPKNYVVYPGFGSFTAVNEKNIDLNIPDDTAKVKFEKAVLRVETQGSCENLQIGVWLNGKRLRACEHEDAELFLPVARNSAYAVREALKFYALPLDLIIPGINSVKIRNLDKKKASSTLFSMEIALYR